MVASINRRWRGFTLVEMLTVLVILGVVSVGILFSVRGPIATARLEHDLEQWQSIDHLLREMAAQSGRMQTLTIDLDAGALWRGETGQEVPLAAGVGVVAIYGPTGKYRAGRVRIPFRVDGSTISYGVQLGEDELSGAHKFLWIAGGSGQMLIRESVEQFHAMWEPSPHA